MPGDQQPVAVVAPVLIDVDDEPHEPAGRSGGGRADQERVRAGGQVTFVMSVM